MAYNSYVPYGYPYYNPYAYQPQQAQYSPPQQQNQPQPQQNSQQIQHSGFVLVQSEQEARAYPVAPGNSITFKDETAPYCYVKTMGFNQLDRPTFERYRLVKEDMPQDAVKSPTGHDSDEHGNCVSFDAKREIDALWREIEALKDKSKEKEVKKTEIERKEVVKDDE